MENPQIAFQLLAREYRPTRLVKFVREHGDDSFVQRFPSQEFLDELPALPTDLHFSHESAICLAVQRVEEHTDGQIGRLYNSGTLLGFVDLDDGVQADLHANGRVHRVCAGDWVLFDDKIPHELCHKGPGYVYAVSIQVCLTDDLPRPCKRS